MITDKTCFVLGAGASKPYGFPLGTELTDMIAEQVVPGGGEAYAFLKSAGYLDGELRRFSEKLRKSRSLSIDAFLGRNPEFETLGTLAITYFISEEEDIRCLDGLSIRNHADKGGRWYRTLFNMMVEGARTYEDFKKNNVSFVTFNYDRSLEQYFYDGLANLFSESLFDLDNPKKGSPETSQKWNELVSGGVMPIVHIYGSVANFRYERSFAVDTFHKEKCLPYGYINEKKYNLGSKDLEYLGDDRVTYYKHTQSEIDIVRDTGDIDPHEGAVKLLKDAETVVFLGFGFDRINCLRLGLPSILRGKKFVYSTAFNSYPAERASFAERIGWHPSEVRTYWNMESILGGKHYGTAESVYFGDLEDDCEALLKKWF